MGTNLINKNDVILFQGDSITDAGRQKDNPAALGHGYAMITAGWMLAKSPELNLKFINRGISGNRTCDLVARWDADCIAIKPNLVSIMIGVNNSWHRYTKNALTADNVFESEYRVILTRVKKELPGTKIVILNPFLSDVPKIMHLHEDLDPKIQIVNKLAKEFADVHIPLDKMFRDAITKQPPEYWAADGVHPTVAGHAFIAQAWLNAVAG
ncbi:MAG: SGNH/GDSL hydrolase family protein [Elusimicrobiota bacterium]